MSIRNTLRLPYEIIVVDDGSASDACISLPLARDVRVLRSEERRGFSHAVNTGIRAASGEVLLFLHADVLLAPHTAEDMLDALIEHPATGAVSAVAPRTYERSRVIPESDYQTWEEFAAVAGGLRAQGITLSPAILAEMFALMVRRDVIEAAGLLDEQYMVPALAAYDYTIRMTRAGYGIASLSGVYVHHGESLHAAEMEEYDQLRERERLTFRSKWGVSLDYSFNARVDILSMMNLSGDGLRVLEIGCACGATLREIGKRNPTARL